MTVFQAVVLGIVQGVTEFLPISSSAHLVLLPHWLGWSFDPNLSFAYDVLLHLGTIGAVMIYFRSEMEAIVVATLRGLWQRKPFESENARVGWLLLLATLPAGLSGLLFKDFVQSWFNTHSGVAALLLVTAFLLVVSERVGVAREKGIGSMGRMDALVIGCFQALAILPGISRSGATMVGGVMRGLDRSTAARFSFLMAVPVMVGAGVVTGLDVLEHRELWPDVTTIIYGFVAALLVGLLSIHWFLRYLQSHSLIRFAWYCALVGVAGLLLGCSPVDQVTATPVPAREIQLGVTPATHDLVQDLIHISPIGQQMVIKPYSSNRRLIAAVHSGGVELGVALYRPNDIVVISTPLALTSLRIIAHPQTSIDVLSRSDLRAVFTGVVTDWEELGGSPGPVKLVSREEGAAARYVFDSLVLAGANPSSEALILAGDDLMLEYVAGTVGAIGYAWQGLVGGNVQMIVDLDDEGLIVPVYAFSYSEPEGQIRNWLAWVQGRESEQLAYGFQQLP